MSKIILLLLTAAFLFETSVYTYQVPAINGGTINLSQYQGKKIFIVNIATNALQSTQLPELEQLYQLHKDSMVVIGFPSNSFGGEPLSNTEIENVLHTTYNITFPLAAKGVVIGDSAQPLYKWLASKNENGVAKFRARGDFQKFLLNSQGRIVGVFDTVTNPLHQRIQAAIRNNN